MAKNKAPTPQEIYRERKQREEQEKTAYLPPGLINHGNTCFMNSVLQGLIATRLLSDLVHFNPIPPEIQQTASTPIVSRRSPQLTNGHNLAGKYEQPWVNTMPIGDMFLTVMYKAWDSQAMRRRDVLSPKSILGALGQKYDQYLDFAQQDAHEFLRILLDAMRMEEQDIIKKRQPPPPPKKRRRTTITPANVRQQSLPQPAASSSSSSQPQANGHVPNGDVHGTPADSHSKEQEEEDNLALLSFADMIFGGQLTSILVCQKCKHVSQTYEDFNDISLSIKAEDYFPQHRKRDRFRRMVGRLTAFPGTSSNSNSNSNSSSGQTPAHLRDPLKFAAQQLRAAPAPAAPPIPTNHIVEIQRASSVPPSPRKEEKELADRDSKDEPRVIEGPRRRSLDVVRHDTEESSGGESPEIPGQLPDVAKEQQAGAEKSAEEQSEREKEKEDAPDGAAVVEKEKERSQVMVNVTGPSDEKHVEFVEPRIDKEKDAGSSNGNTKEGKDTNEGKEKEKDKKSSVEDGWAKLGRRISLTVGLGRQKSGDKDKEKERKDRDRKSRSVERSSGAGGLGFIKEVMPEEMLKSFSANNAAPSSSTSMLSDLGSGMGLGKKRVASDGGVPSSSWASSSSTEAGSANVNSSGMQKSSKPLPPQPTSSTTSIPATSSATHLNPSTSTPSQSTQHHHHHLFSHVQRSKSPKPPKPSAAETEYLRRILADISATASSGGSSNGGGGGAFASLFRPTLLHSHSSGPTFTSSSSTTSTTSSPSNVTGTTGTAIGSTVDKGKSVEKPSWLGMGLRSFTGLEECLRMFTAVEVLDGENMVGCRRCWKIQNGVYRTHEREEDSDREDEEEGQEEKEEDDEIAGSSGSAAAVPLQQNAPRSALNIVAPSIPSTDGSGSSSVHILTSVSTPTVSFYSHDNDNTSDDADSRSISSLPTEATAATSGMHKDDVNGDALSNGQVQGQAGPGGLPIPVISTTAPDTPPAWSTSSSAESSSSSSAAQAEADRASAYARLTGQENEPTSSANVPAPNPKLTQALYGYNTTSGSKDSLVIPNIGRPRPGGRSRSRKSYSESTTTDDNDDSSDDDDDSDTSAGTSVSADSVASLVSRPGDGAQRNATVPQQQLVNRHAQPPLVPSSSLTSSSSSKVQQQPQAASSSSSAPAPTKKPSKPKAPKPVIMRPAYKRYLIATPPPVLVIHLKRFQQTSKAPLLFSHGFKKLEDYVSFPEYLDLTPFLAPRKEDYGLGKKGRDKDKERKVVIKGKEERCMYRLYAVVVHIGNMLGGHYVAYTALPNESPVRSTSASPPANEAGNSGKSASAPESESGGDKETSSNTNAKADSAPLPEQQPSKPAERQWAYISDTVVRLTTLEEVLHAKAYICMYERC